MPYFTNKLMLGQVKTENQLNQWIKYEKSHPEVSIGQMRCRIGGVDGLFAIDFDDAAILYIPHVLQLIEDISGFVFDQDGRVGRLQHSCGEFLREHVHDERMQRLQTVELMGDVNTPGLISKLEEKHTWGGGGK